VKKLRKFSANETFVLFVQLEIKNRNFKFIGDVIQDTNPFNLTD